MRAAAASSDQDADIASLTSVWQAFLSRLSAKDLDGALAQVAPAAKPKFRAAIGAVGSDPAAFARAVQGFEVIEIQGGYARAAIVMRRDDRDGMFFVTFDRQRNGSWRIYAM